MQIKSQEYMRIMIMEIYSQEKNKHEMVNCIGNMVGAPDKAKPFMGFDAWYKEKTGI